MIQDIFPHLFLLIVVHEDKSVENSTNGSTKKRTDPEDPVIVPVVANNGRSKAPGGVDAGAGVGNEEEMGHRDSETNQEGR